jgi:arylformamidase
MNRREPDQMARPVFLHYDRAALDAQYNNRAKVADFQSWLDRWKSASARARDTLTCRLDVGYGPSAAEALNVFPATGGVATPVLVFIHGGYWMALDKSDADFVALGLVPQGVAVVNVNYALMPGARMDEVVRQCRAAVAWTLRNAATFGGDPQRVWVAGHSAGGHLTAMVAATDWDLFLLQDKVAGGLPEPSARPAGGWGLSGLYDLEPIRLCYLNDTLAMDAGEAARNSPLTLPAPSSGRWTLAVGGDEGPEYLRQTWQQAAAWGSDGARQVSAQVLVGTHHFSIATRLGDPDDPLAQAIASDVRRPA